MFPVHRSIAIFFLSLYKRDSDSARFGLSEKSAGVYASLTATATLFTTAQLICSFQPENLSIQFAFRQYLLS
jgi:hypothetical protein